MHQVSGTKDHNFERFYVAARKKEGRIYTDAQLRQLPDIAAGHRHAREWQVRKRSADKLIKALDKEKKTLSVLEIGCGNGWLCCRLSRAPGLRITGVDINTLELAQAQRVFRQQENLHFMAGDIRTGMLRGRLFDRIVFAAAIQYFPSLCEILGVAFDHLAADGEIHILDTFFYDKRELAAAKKRTEEYYQSLCVPEMTDYYFHHAWEDLAAYPFQLINQRSWLERITAGRAVFFPWVKIKKSWAPA